MLILTRKASEAICIGERIEIEVLAIRGNEVQIGIHAPRDVTVDREEVAQRNMRERGQVGNAPRISGR